MTTDDLIAYYADLLPAEYRTKPKAYATIQALAALGLLPQGGNVVVDGDGNPVFDGHGNLVVDGPYGQIIPLAITLAFNLNNAVGQQLDFLAREIGTNRDGYSLSGQFVTLDDDDFRKLTLAAWVKNFLIANGKNVFPYVQRFFSGIMRLKDEQGMRITYTYLLPVYPAPGNLLWVELFVTEGFLPRPLGVGMGSLIFTNPLLNFFGERLYLTVAPPWVDPEDTYTAPVARTHPEILYSDGKVFE